MSTPCHAEFEFDIVAKHSIPEQATDIRTWSTSQRPRRTPCGSRSEVTTPATVAMTRATARIDRSHNVRMCREAPALLDDCGYNRTANVLFSPEVKMSAVSSVADDSSIASVPQDPSILRTNELTLRYGRNVAVDALSLSVHRGEIYGFLGRNGAGKTSTIRTIMGICKPDSGSIEFNGQPLRRIKNAQKRQIGYVSQEQFFYPWMTCRGIGKFVGGLYPTWEADEFARLLTVLELPPDRRVAHLSGGMRVKLALALALAHRPPMLILDEPTAGLDPVARREFLDIIRSQARQHDRTTFFSSHLIDEVERVADRVGIIHRGKLQFEGPLDELRRTVREVNLGTIGKAPAEPSADPTVLPAVQVASELEVQEVVEVAEAIDVAQAIEVVEEVGITEETLTAQQDGSDGKPEGVLEAIEVDSPIEVANDFEVVHEAGVAEELVTEVGHSDVLNDSEANPEVIEVSAAIEEVMVNTPEVNATAAVDSSIDHSAALQDLATRAGLRYLRRGLDDRPTMVFQGTPDAWARASASGITSSTLSLEDAFIALASSDVQKV